LYIGTIWRAKIKIFGWLICIKPPPEIDHSVYFSEKVGGLQTVKERG